VHLAGIFLLLCARMWCFMLNRYAKGALICAVLPIGLLASGCSWGLGLGNPGYGEFAAGNYEQSKVDFANDFQRYPDNPLTNFNMGATYHQEGNVPRADVMYSEAAASGKDYQPSNFLEADSRDATITTIACRHLHEDRQLDVNCGDQMAVIVPIQPAPVVAEAIVQPAPAVEAAAAYVPPVTPRKQDRN
jgi:hypothetical protein